MYMKLPKYDWCHCGCSWNDILKAENPNTHEMRFWRIVNNITVGIFFLQNFICVEFYFNFFFYIFLYFFLYCDFSSRCLVVDFVFPHLIREIFERLIDVFSGFTWVWLRWLVVPWNFRTGRSDSSLAWCGRGEGVDWVTAKRLSSWLRCRNANEDEHLPNLIVLFHTKFHR